MKYRLFFALQVVLLAMIGFWGPALADSPTLQAIQGLPQALDTTLPANDPGGACPAASSRFTCVMGGAAVRDNETGLVWEQSPSTSTFSWAITISFLATAAFHCNDLKLGNRTGWRLPTIQELASLVDRSQSNPALPAGHPFNNVQSSRQWWSATTIATFASHAWSVDFSLGEVRNDDEASNGFVWCVRGGQGVDSQ